MSIAAPSVQVRLPGGPSAPALARAAVTERFAGDMDAAGLGRLLVLTSEVVTNAVVHAGADAGRQIGLRLARAHGAIRVAVSDPGAGGVPALRGENPLEPGGLGLLLVERMSVRWGVERRGTLGHEVWFEFRPSEDGSAR